MTLFNMSRGRGCTGLKNRHDGNLNNFFNTSANTSTPVLGVRRNVHVRATCFKCRWIFMFVFHGKKRRKKTNHCLLDSLTEPSLKYLQRFRIPLKDFESVNTLHIQYSYMYGSQTYVIHDLKNDVKFFLYRPHGWDIAEWLQRLTSNVKFATTLFFDP